MAAFLSLDGHSYSSVSEDAGSLCPFSLVASFLAAAVPRVLMLNSMSFIQIHAE